MANLIFLLVLSVTTCITIAKNVEPDDVLDFSCDYAYGVLYSLPLRQYYDTQATLVKGSKRLNVTLPMQYLYQSYIASANTKKGQDFGSHSAVTFVCVNITGVDTETTDVSFTVTKDHFLTVLVTLDEEAQNNILVDIRTIVVTNIWRALQML